MKTDNEKLIKWIEESRWIDFQGNILTAPARQIADYLISKGTTIPVRCGECIYMEEAYEKNGFLICPASGMEITNTDFCSYGERKEND